MVVLQLTAKLIASTMTTSTSPECFFLVVALMRAKRKVRVAWTHLRATTVPVRALLQACRWSVQLALAGRAGGVAWATHEENVHPTINI
jgi:hypothetical protein